MVIPLGLYSVNTQQRTQRLCIYFFWKKIGPWKLDHQVGQWKKVIFHGLTSWSMVGPTLSMITSWNSSRYLGSKYIKVFVINHECATNQTHVFPTTKSLSMVWIFVLFWLECHLLFLHAHRVLVVPQTTPPFLLTELRHSILWFCASLIQDATNIALSFVASLA
jgi:hypothetical protein